MKRLLYFSILILFVSNLFAQDEKEYINFIGNVRQVYGSIDNIETNIRGQTLLIIRSNSRVDTLIFEGSSQNNNFLSYIEENDLIYIKEEETELKVAIFKKLDESVKVRVFHMRNDM